MSSSTCLLGAPSFIAASSARRTARAGDGGGGGEVGGAGKGRRADLGATQQPTVGWRMGTGCGSVCDTSSISENEVGTHCTASAAPGPPRGTGGGHHYAPSLHPVRRAAADGHLRDGRPTPTAAVYMGGPVSSCGEPARRLPPGHLGAAAPWNLPPRHSEASGAGGAPVATAQLHAS
jgi:hypothetical protein